MHMLAGIFMIDLFLPSFDLFLSFYISLLSAFIVATIVMAGKELIYDKRLNKGVCSLNDFIAGEIGIVIQTITFIIYNFI